MQARVYFTATCTCTCTMTGQTRPESAEWLTGLKSAQNKIIGCPSLGTKSNGLSDRRSKVGRFPKNRSKWQPCMSDIDMLNAKYLRKPSSTTLICMFYLWIYCKSTNFWPIQMFGLPGLILISAASNVRPVLLPRVYTVTLNLAKPNLDRNKFRQTCPVCETYDLVPGIALWRILQRLGVPPRMLCKIQSLHEGTMFAWPVWSLTASR